ncbi:B-cell receptor-associated protein 31-like-domain-containing protein [Globomyces pollinis-pini]|nr:B-cell receptor-associated protein 31-like-domain-containing protein [Globomyces pollinis-pini]
MSLLYQGVFAVLMIEVFAFLLLLAPLPLSWRVKLIKAASSSKLASSIAYGGRIIFIIVLVLFADNVNRSVSVKEQHDHHHDKESSHVHDSNTDTFLHAKMFQAQRNMYLTGSVLFLGLVLNRFFNLILELHTNEQKTEILKQQAAKTTKEYLKLLDKEQKEKEGNVKSKVEASNSSASTEVEKLKKELEIVKKQASQTNDEYMKLTDKYVALEKKLSGSKENKKDV